MNEVSQSPEGLHIVTISGGSGGNALSKALAPYTSEFDSITSIVTSFDSGGSSKILRDVLGVPAIGDFRNVLSGYADPEAASVLEMRAKVDIDHESTPEMHPLGSIVLAHMMKGLRPSFDAYREIGVKDDYLEAAEQLISIAVGKEGMTSRSAAKEYLSAFGRGDRNIHVTMISNSLGDLVAAWSGGVILGESLIGSTRFNGEVPNLSIRAIKDDHEPTLEEQIQRDIGKAAAVILAPGSINTSIGQALAHSGLRKAVEDAQKLVVIGNIVDDSQEHLDHSSYINGIAELLNGREPDAMIVNSGRSGNLETDRNLIFGGTEAVNRTISGDMLRMQAPGKDNDQHTGAVHDPVRLGPLVMKSIEEPTILDRVRDAFTTVLH